MKERLSLIIGTIIVFSVVTGFTIYNDYVIKESKTGPIIEKSIEDYGFDDVLVYTNNK